MTIKTNNTKRLSAEDIATIRSYLTTLNLDARGEALHQRIAAKMKLRLAKEPAVEKPDSLRWRESLS